MLALYAKAINAKPTAFNTANSDVISVLPDLQRHNSGIVNTKHCGYYNKLTLWPSKIGDLVHPNYMQTLSLKMQLDMMVDPAFPFKPLGLVHIANEIVVNRLPHQHQHIDIHCALGQVYFHRKGWLFEVLTQVYDAKQSESPLLVATSFYLSRQRHETCDTERLSMQYSCGPNWLGHNATMGVDGLSPQTDSKTEHIDIAFPANIGRRYARISGDYNPIHLHPMTAKLLGFKTAIAHGMYSKAVVLSEIANYIPFYKNAFKINTVFKQPIMLPLSTQLGFRTYMPATLIKNASPSKVKSSHCGIDLSCVCDFELGSKKIHKDRTHLTGKISAPT